MRCCSVWGCGACERIYFLYRRVPKSIMETNEVPSGLSSRSSSLGYLRLLPMLMIYIATYAIRMPAATSIIRASVSWDTDTLLLLSNKVPGGDTGNNGRHRYCEARSGQNQRSRHLRVPNSWRCRPISDWTETSHAS